MQSHISICAWREEGALVAATKTIWKGYDLCQLPLLLVWHGDMAFLRSGSANDVRIEGFVRYHQLFRTITEICVVRHGLTIAWFIILRERAFERSLLFWFTIASCAWPPPIQPNPLSFRNLSEIFHNSRVKKVKETVNSEPSLSSSP